MKIKLLALLITLLSVSAKAQTYGYVEIAPYPAECLVVVDMTLDELADELIAEGDLWYVPYLAEIEEEFRGNAVYSAKIPRDEDYRYILFITTGYGRTKDILAMFVYDMVEDLSKECISWYHPDALTLQKICEEFYTEALYIINYGD